MNPPLAEALGDRVLEVEDGDELDPIPWSLHALIESMGPATQRNMARRRRAVLFEIRLAQLIPWMRHPLWRLMSMVWVGPIDEGFVQIFKPRWGAITFSYLNDGIKPTVWHTFAHLVGLDDMIWPDGAPTFSRWLKERKGK